MDVSWWAYQWNDLSTSIALRGAAYSIQALHVAGGGNAGVQHVPRRRLQLADDDWLLPPG